MSLKDSDLPIHLNRSFVVKIGYNPLKFSAGMTIVKEDGRNPRPAILIKRGNLLINAVRNRLMVFALGVLTLCCSGSALAEGGVSTGAKPVQAHVYFKIIIPPTLVMNTDAIATGNLVTGLSGVQTAVAIEDIQAFDALAAAGDRFIPLASSPGGQSMLVSSPPTGNGGSPHAAWRQFILCAP